MSERVGLIFLEPSALEAKDCLRKQCGSRFWAVKMETWQAFFLGIMVAYTPTLVLFAVLLRRAPQV